MGKSDGKISWRVRGVDAIANEMIRGLCLDRWNASSDEEKARFREKYKALIEEVLPHVPRGFSTIGAVVCKCAIRYDKQRAIDFLKSLKDMTFKGKRDPVYLFSLWLDNPRRPKKNRVLTYKITMVACRAYCQERELKMLRVPNGDQDVFEWDEKWEFDAYRYGKGKGKPKNKRKKPKVTDAMKQKITYCLGKQDLWPDEEAKEKRKKSLEAK